MTRIGQAKAKNAAEVFRQWEEWVAKQIGGSQQHRDAAMNAIRKAIQEKRSQGEIVAAALSAVQATQNINSRHPPRAPLLSIEPIQGVMGPFGVVLNIIRGTRQHRRRMQPSWSLRIKPHGSNHVVDMAFYGDSLRGSLAEGDLVHADERIIKRPQILGIAIYNYTTGGAITRGPMREVKISANTPRVQLPKVEGTISNLILYGEIFPNPISQRLQPVKRHGMSFRIKTVNPYNGSPLYVPVDVRFENQDISQLLRSGDVVELDEAWFVGKTLCPKIIINHTTQRHVIFDNPKTLDFQLTLRKCVHSFYYAAFTFILLYNVNPHGQLAPLLSILRIVIALIGILAIFSIWS